MLKCHEAKTKQNKKKNKQYILLRARLTYLLRPVLNEKIIEAKIKQLHIFEKENNNKKTWKSAQ